MAKTREQLLEDITAAIRSNGEGGATTAQDVRDFLRSLVNETYDQLDTLTSTFNALSNTVAGLGSGSGYVTTIGGYREVATIDARDAIKTDDQLHEDGLGSGERRLGMLVVVTDTDNPQAWTTWRLEIPAFKEMGDEQKRDFLSSNTYWSQLSSAAGISPQFNNYLVVEAQEQRDQLPMGEGLHADGLGSGSRRLGMLVLTTNESDPNGWQLWRLDIPNYLNRNDNERMEVLATNDFWVQKNLN